MVLNRDALVFQTAQLHFFITSKRERRCAPGSTSSSRSVWPSPWNKPTSSCPSREISGRGDVTLREWIPTQAVVRTALDEAATHALVSIFPGARIDVEDLYASSERAIRARQRLTRPINGSP